MRLYRFPGNGRGAGTLRNSGTPSIDGLGMRHLPTKHPGSKRPPTSPWDRRRIRREQRTSRRANRTGANR